jgi:predicted MPP superfamily phosphohydrolase
MALIYLLLFVSPQVLLYGYLRERLPDPARPGRARLVRAGLAVVFTVFNFPWLFVARRVLLGSVWGMGRIPYLGPWIAWQMLGWIFFGLVAVYVIAKAVVWLAKRVRGEWGVVREGALRSSTDHRPVPLSTPHDVLSRRRFLVRATYAYAAAGAALSTYGIWNAERLPEVTRRTLTFPDLPPGLDGLRLLHLSDVHAGVHMEQDKMQALVAQANALGADLIVQTGDMIDIDPAYIPPYVRAFRELSAPLGVVTVLGNHDRYTGADAVIRGVRDAGQVFVRNDVHVIERGGATLALVGIDDPRNWKADDPQPLDIDLALRRTPPHAFQILLAHRPGAFDGAAPRGIPLTLAGHIHGGQFYLPILGWSAGRLITKYVMGHFRQGNSQLYVSRGIGVVGVPIRVFVPPEIALLELRRTVGPSD